MPLEETNTMALNYHSISPHIRELMLQEFNHDLDCENCYYSKRFNDNGVKCFVDIMRKHIIDGTDDGLAQELKERECFKSHEERVTAKGTTLAKVPVTAAQTFAEGEFNRFYIRALCLKAIEENRQLKVYRARHSENPRADSEALLDSVVDPHKLLKDLRDNIGIDTSFGLPSGPNSGLSVFLI
jgi:hypothetical protein